ncbi:MAG: IS200/IS605 family transposase [Alphaproteobacteria bacterium]|nr:IS200/IS605 family transposase [Alphaproteobacteria bacterium]
MIYRRSSHSVYDIECHIVFCTKYRCGGAIRQYYRAMYKVIRKVCSANYVDIISGNISPYHVHMLSSVPPYLPISRTVQYIKRKVAGNCKGNSMN